MKSTMKLAVLVAAVFCSSLCVAEDSHYGVTVSAPTASGNNAKPDSVPNSNGQSLPPIGQNCHTEKVCTAVSCTAYDNQGKCTSQQCVAWEDRFVCK